MKKVLRVLLFMMITALSVSAVGCGGENKVSSESLAPTSQTTKNPTPAGQATDSPAPTSQATDGPAPTSQATDGPAPTSQATDSPAPTSQPTKSPTPTNQATDSPTPTSQPTKSPTPSATAVQQTPSPSADTGDGAKTVLYQLGDTVKNNQMMSYVIYTKDKKLILIDGGYDWNSDQLIELCKKVTGQNVPVVDAWFLSHCHSDHINAFSSIMSASSPKLNVKKVYYNFPTKDFIQKYEPASMDTYNRFENARKKLTDDQLHVVKKGEKIQIGSVLVEVLMIPDERFTSNAMNDSSVPLRMTIEGQRIVFLGDLGPESGGRFRQAIQNDPTCDIVQMAHHGSNGILFSIYKIMKPKVCLWPTPDWLWENHYMGSTEFAKEFNTIELYEFMKEMGVTKHYVAKNEIQQFTFPMDLS